jgi:DNA (cytosine-5)-methyltransferase 1
LLNFPDRSREKSRQSAEAIAIVEDGYVRRQRRLAKTNLPVLVDLFCGCGGMSLGAARAGFDVAAGVDVDHRALAAHTLNFSNSKDVSLDLSEATGRGILAAAALKPGQIDVVAGGPPCQGFSTIGHQNLLDERNLLIAHFLRLVDELRPRAFVLENVPGILDDRFTETLERALGKVSGQYEVLDPHPLVALEAGAPTLRKRVFIVGFRKSISIPKEFWDSHIHGQDVPVVRHALDGLPLDVLADWKNSRGGKRSVRVSRSGAFFKAVTGRIPSGVGNREALESYLGKGIVSGCLGTVHSDELTSRYAALEYGKADHKTKSVRLDPDGYCPTLRAGTGPDRGSFQAVRPIHYLRPRVITPREAARLQGFPDWFQFDTTKWHSFRQIGNSVSPLVAEFVMKKTLGVLNA